ncbi:ATP-binding protein [Sphingomonas sp. BE137]|jgi:two-component system sensor histidine kinase QseC|uniref:ATP-binding protein n=1 Tax=Sphingomonas sp. BE137 TaxID=2817844 RepID=UPI001AE7D4A3|nr:ATP-binding protein [Sphingomonas sp. BE137]MDR6846916.1 two-component system sensor histidine kinase QseC [Sphingomonas sp. BE137]
MNSLRIRLFVLLAAVTALVWASAATWIYFNTRVEVEKVLDRRLVEAARMVGSLANASGGVPVGPSLERGSPFATSGYDRQLSCQIWSLDGKLLGRSTGAPLEPLGSDGSGFSERSIHGETWRVYSFVDRTRGLRVHVGDNLSVRRNLVNDLIKGLVLPALIGMLALAALLWTGIGRGLSPLRDVAKALERRDPSDLRPLDIREVRDELRPVVRSVDGLFDRLERGRASERHLIASAAHELQTPLAGLKTHAQIAAMSDDPDVRARALLQIQTSVDRTARLVRQLLDLARQEALGDPPSEVWTKADAAVSIVQDELCPSLELRHVGLEVDPALACLEVRIDEGALILSLRNLIENAVNHSAAGGTVRISMDASDQRAGIAVIDDGPGIPEDELASVRERFVRGRREKGAGSGLGLSIVELVLNRAGGMLQLANRAEGGLHAAMLLPVSAVRRTGIY